jgi:alanine dehydrogenase
MIIGVPKETLRHERRVGLTPDAAAHLRRLGHTILVQQDAGVGARFSNQEYERGGAQIVYGAEEAYLRADLVTRIGSMSVEDLELLKPGSTVCSFQHLAVAPRELIAGLIERQITAISYELIEDDAGSRPILTPFSEMAGMLAVHLAAYYLQSDSGGRGILLGNVTGIAPPTVVVLGAGIAGQTAACRAEASGAHVVVVDSDMSKLRTVAARCNGQVATANASLEPLEKYTARADVLIGAVLIPGSRAPILVTEEMVEGMPKGSVIVDLSIDQGGCVETSRPTTLDQPTFLVHDVVHYCVPNMTASIARTASQALTRAVLPQLEALAERGVARAATEDRTLAAGVVLYDGRLVHPQVAAAHGLPSTKLGALLAGGRA